MARARTITIKDRRIGRWGRTVLMLKRFGKIGALSIIVIWAGLWLALSGGFSRMARWSENEVMQATVQAGYSVQDILVEGRINTDPAEIKRVLAVSKGDPIFRFDPVKAQQTIKTISWVKDAHVERRLPGTVYIGLTEREPLALWQHEKKLKLVDTEGQVVVDDRLDRFKNLVIITGENAPGRAPSLMALLKAEPELLSRTEAASLVGDRRWDLEMKNGITVNLPESDVSLALSRLARAQQQDRLLDKDIVDVDLREADRIIVKTRPGAVQDYREGEKPGSAI